MSGIEIALLASAAVSTVGALASASAQAQAAENQAAAARYNAQVQENQALVADMNMKAAGEQAARKEEMQRRRFAQLQGQALAGLAQSGTDIGSGSNADILKQNEIQNELDSLTIRYEGSNARDSFYNQGQNLRSQAQLSLMNASMYDNNASNAMTAGYLNAGANLLGGYTRYAYYGQTGRLI